QRTIAKTAFAEQGMHHPCCRSQKQKDRGQPAGVINGSGGEAATPAHDSHVGSRHREICASLRSRLDANKSKSSTAAPAKPIHGKAVFSHSIAPPRRSLRR